MLDWLKKIWDFVTPKEPSLGKMSEGNNSAPNSHQYDRLEKKKRKANEEKKKIKPSPMDWYRLSLPQKEERENTTTYQAYKFGKVLSLKVLKDYRIKKDAQKIKALENEVNILLDNVENLIGQRKAKNAKTRLEKDFDKIIKVRDVTIRQRHQQLQSCLTKLITELEQEELARLAEERRYQEEEAQRQKEAKEKEKKEEDRKEREERERREAEAKRLADEARRKEVAERQERQRLEALSSELKDDWQDFKKVLDENGIKYLYHFTDKSNIPSIKRHGGLLSWSYCDNKGISIPRPGGIGFGRQLDCNRGLQDYVRLCFTREHPMMYVAKKDGRIPRPVILVIDIKAALIKGALFSNKNATIEREPVNIGETLADLKKIHFQSIKASKHFDLDENERSYYQAEVMIKTFLPKRYIINLDKIL